MVEPVDSGTGFFLRTLRRFEPINDQCSPSYRNQSINLHCESIDLSLYDGKHRLLMV